MDAVKDKLSASVVGGAAAPTGIFPDLQQLSYCFSNKISGLLLGNYVKF